MTQLQLSKLVLCATLIIINSQVNNTCKSMQLNTKTVLVRTNMLDVYVFVDGEDEGISQQLRLNLQHNRFIIQLLLNYVEDNMIFVHVGAHLGIESLVLSKYAQNHKYSNFKVIALEPNQFNYILLTKSVYLNDLQDIVTVMKEAITNKIGIAQIAIRNIDTSAAQIVQDFTTKRKADYKYSVKTVTLDWALRKYMRENNKVGLVYLSCNTMEIEALLGMSALIQRNPEMVILMDWKYSRNSHKNIDGIINLYNNFKNRQYRLLELLVPDNSNQYELKSINDLKSLLSVKYSKILLLPLKKKLPNDRGLPEQ